LNKSKPLLPSSLYLVHRYNVTAKHPVKVHCYCWRASCTNELLLLGIMFTGELLLRGTLYTGTLLQLGIYCIHKYT
jgi:hypothetical protein